MRKTNRTINVNIPFCGYYESVISSMIDDNSESFIDELRNPQYYGYSPLDLIDDDELRAKIEKFSPDQLADSALNILWRHENSTIDEYSHEINQKWIDLLCDNFHSEYGIDLKPNLNSVTMDSPREYNFETDRLFCGVSFNAIKTLYEENKTQCDDYIFNRMKPRSGFIPYYPNDTKQWGDCESWDYNQWGLILEALITDSITDRTNDDISYYISENCPLSLDCSYDELFQEILDDLTE